MEENKIPSWLRSSANNQNISLTFKGVGVAVVPIVIFFGKLFGLDVAEADLTQLIEAVAAVASAVLVAAGLGRKVWLKVFPKKE